MNNTTAPVTLDLTVSISHTGVAAEPWVQPVVQSRSPVPPPAQTSTWTFTGTINGGTATGITGVGGGIPLGRRGAVELSDGPTPPARRNSPRVSRRGRGLRVDQVDEVAERQLELDVEQPQPGLLARASPRPDPAAARRWDRSTVSIAR